MAHVLGNVALADYGQTRGPELLEAGVGASRARRPALAQSAVSPVTQQSRVRLRASDALAIVDRQAPATAAFAVDLADVHPAVTITDGQRTWTVRRDLLNSSRFDADFVVETEDDARAFIRFGDGATGRRPAADAALTARYRIGNGSAGNVGADTLTRLVAQDPRIAAVRNPLPAAGGADPHALTQAKLYAPQAFRRQERAVTLADYQAVTERHPDVQRAVATRRWTGSWHTIFITVDRRGGLDIDAPFERELTRFLERYRLAAHDLEIVPPVFVPLDVAFAVCAGPDHFAADVKARLIDVFSRRDRTGAKGFFHPDNFTFGTPVYLSAMIARAMQVPGVASIVPVTFQRFGRRPAHELRDGVLVPHRLEIARLDNDANAPERGRLDFSVRGGA
jgi:predicted phage baseplate assembly protein